MQRFPLLLNTCVIGSIALPLCLFAEAQQSRTIYARQEPVELEHSGKDYTIEFKTPLAHYETRYHRSESFSFDDFDWWTFFHRVLGKGLEPVERVILDRVVRRLDEIAVDEHFSTAQTVSLVYAFVQQLAAQAKPRSKPDATYMPHELLEIGPVSPWDSVILTSAILSGLCINIQVVSLGEKWNLAVLAARNLEGQTYVVDGATYLIMDKGKEDAGGGPRSASIAVPINEWGCEGRKRHFEPLKEYPNRLSKAFPKAIEQVAVGIDGVRQTRTRGTTWRLDLAPIVGNAHATRGTPQTGYLFQRGAAHDRIEGEVSDDTMNHALFLGGKDGAFRPKAIRRIDAGD